jgi:hypothetical protein
VTPQTLFHRLADFVLRIGIRLAPSEAREWGNAMLGELQHIEGKWAAVSWALGGAGVLAKQSLIALLLPSRGGQPAPVGNPLAREGKMHKASLMMGGACLAAVLLFFLAPVFRQGFRVSLAQWQSVIHVDQSGWYRQPGLESFAGRVEKNRDAEGMAFAAVRLHDGDECVRLADEAVRLNPKLVWVLGIVGGRFSTAPGVTGWARRLAQWDPGNALPYLILAQRENLEHIADGSYFHQPQPSAAWMDAMAGAFRSNRVDDYTEQLQKLDRTVVQRYPFSNPYFLVESGDRSRLPSYAVVNSFRYAKLVIASGDALEAHGDSKGAIEKYLMVIHFLHAFNLRATYPFFFDSLKPTLYTRLAAVYKKMGNTPQSAYFAGLAATASHKWEQHGAQWRSEMENQGRISGVTPWNAMVVEASDVAMLASFCLLLIVLIVVPARSRTLRPSKLRTGPVATALGFLGSVGLLVSSVTLYVTYRPYAAIYTRFLQTGDTSQLKILREFLDFTRSPIGTQFYPRPNPFHHGGIVIAPYVSPREFTFYFWLAVTVLGVTTLAAMGGWHLLKRRHPRAGAAA